LRWGFEEGRRGRDDQRILLAAALKELRLVACQVFKLLLLEKDQVGWGREHGLMAKL
jgi:hypothetical protein